ncbi:DEAD/DEAH box helicase family protein [Streptomyces sp. NPDC005494]|uniref:DEAD/DEAH box helicase family protein n=1 Tax=Streptomyces sp. NPDC005494 TaxID=3364715 RepID=UPI0036AE81F5
MDDRLRDLAKASPNFGVLYQHQPLLALYGAQAELNVFSNPNAAQVQAGQFGEVLAEDLVTRTGIRVAGTRQIDRLRALSDIRALSPAVRDAFDQLRRERNEAAHAHLFDTTRALEAVRLCYELGVFYHRALTGKRTVTAFVPPAMPVLTDPAEVAELRQALDGHRDALAQSRVKLSESTDRLEAERRARAEAEALMVSAQQAKAALAARLVDMEAEIVSLRTAQHAQYETDRKQPRRVNAAAREAIVHRAQRPAPLNEVQARQKIDVMLDEAGWLVQDRADLNPLAGRGVAVREFTLATGRADYVLYVDGKIVGVIEAKREGDHLSGALAQNERYAKGVLKEHALAVWRESEPFAFRYATTGTETYFVNRLDPEARSREVFSFHRPETVAAWMERAEDRRAPTFRAGLRRMPKLEPYGLRLAQIDAISGLEQSLAQDRPRALIHMATGAGKTFTAVTETYRLLRHAGARRVLFLVDRNNLGRQALSEFRNYTTPDDGRKFAELYNVDRLGAAGLQDTSSVVICTIQKMYALLKGEQLTDDDARDDAADAQRQATDATLPGESSGSGTVVADDTADDPGMNYATDLPIEVEYQPDVPPESFDLIVVDECHRSIYGLWRGVLDYFDAHLVGLTATPTAQTRGFFDQNTVSEYTYEQAVADGVNVDFDVVRVSTDLREQGGAKIEAGTTVRIKDRKTRAQRYVELDDDLTYTTGQIGRSVITVDEIRAVLTTYKNNWQRWFPGRKDLPKTLIFAVGEDHAEDVLKQVKEVFGRGDSFAKKITYKSRQNGDNPDELINDLRNSPQLRVAVTVDMIATGTDVRALECVIFLRSVRSAVLFEQMKGRGARTIPANDLRNVTPDADDDVTKDRFVLIDAAGVTTSPLVDARPMIPATGKQVSLAKLLDKAGSRSISAEEAEILQRRLSRLNQQLKPEERDLLTHTAGGTTLATIARGIVDAVDVDAQDEARRQGGQGAARKLVEDAVAVLTGNPELRRQILEIRRDKDLTYDETTSVTVTEVAEIPREKRARENLDEWGDLLKKQRDRNAAIQVALGSGNPVSPAEARAALKELAATIRASRRSWTPSVLWGFHEDLNQAVARPGREAGLPDLISLIRYELGADSELRPYRTVVQERFEGWLLRQQQAGVEFTDDQWWWLEKIRDVVASDVGIEPAELAREPFTERGKGRGFMMAFGGKEPALDLLTELNRELA